MNETTLTTNRNFSSFLHRGNSISVSRFFSIIRLRNKLLIRDGTCTILDFERCQFSNRKFSRENRIRPRLNVFVKSESFDGFSLYLAYFHCKRENRASKRGMGTSLEKKDRGDDQRRRRRRKKTKEDRPPPLVDTGERACKREKYREGGGGGRERPSPSASASFRAPAASLSSRRRASWEAGRGSISDTPDRSLCRRVLVSSPSPCSRRSRPEIISTVLHRFASLSFSFFFSPPPSLSRDSTSSRWKSFVFTETPLQQSRIGETVSLHF